MRLDLFFSHRQTGTFVIYEWIDDPFIGYSFASGEGKYLANAKARFSSVIMTSRGGVNREHTNNI